MVSHEGSESWNSNRYAASRCPWSASAGRQVGRGQEAGRQVVARLVHQGGEVVGDALPVLVGHQPEAQGAHQRGLGVAA
jgi:hypothetical protein